ncbi:DUF6094 domain-containing protein [Herpetosiphon geysericola]|uniref:DUF6094 domain-containing protein n=1 Tax=Herpetosiphon geysericola TaxID=70996 RepID=A0A0P6XVG2_9CHLR|nr:DUF6094 domain-containing protein [Herpetosiphon geysericola]KPL87548.1 hypothetical protein SE18_10820 [Herpetosiphon geysericola]
MARLANTANHGFQALDPAAVALLATYVTAANPAACRIADPCAGEGAAAWQLARAWGIPADQLYLNELHTERAAACRGMTSNTTSCDTVRWLRANHHGLQLVYLNPPFGTQAAGDERSELQFFRRVIEEGNWLQPGGIAILVTPQDVFAKPAVTQHLARHYDNLTIMALPAALRRWREAIVIGVRRARARSGQALSDLITTLTTQLAQPLPELTMQAAPRYTIPVATNSTIVWEDATIGTPDQATTDVVVTGGATNTRAYRSAIDALRIAHLRPLGPLSATAAAARIATGEINGATIIINGRPQIIKGSTSEDQTVWVETKEEGDTTTLITHHVTRQVPVVMTVDVADGSVCRYEGDAGLQKLLADPATAEALLAAITAVAPPIYAYDMDDQTAATLAMLKRKDGRTLPGYENGLLPMQKHVVAGITRYLTTPDPRTRTLPKGTLLNAEMGSGKSTMGIAIAHWFHQQSLTK